MDPGEGGAGGPLCLGRGRREGRVPRSPGAIWTRRRPLRAPQGRPGRAGALRPCCPAGGSAASAAPPTAAAAPRAPPSRCRAPAPSARPGAPTGSWRAGTGRSCRGGSPRWLRPGVRSRRPAGSGRAARRARGAGMAGAGVVGAGWGLRGRRTAPAAYASEPGDLLLSPPRVGKGASHAIKVTKFYHIISNDNMSCWGRLFRWGLRVRVPKQTSWVNLDKLLTLSVPQFPFIIIILSLLRWL